MDVSGAENLILECFSAALAATDPRTAVARAVASLSVDELAGREVTALAFGKAATAMVRGLGEALPVPIARGVVITKEGHRSGPLPPGVEAFEAAHPIPDERSLHATTHLLEVARSSSPDGVVFVLVSGGGSALLELPVEGVSLEELAALTRDLLRRGASIHELNTVRSRLSQVKGGGLLHAVRAQRVETLVLSDVLGNDLSVIASGPTVPLTSGPEEAVAVVERYGLRESMPSHILALLSMAESSAPSAVASRQRVTVVADNDTAVDAAAEHARSTGRPVTVTWRRQEGEARELARAWVGLALATPPEVDVLIGGGEATVTVRGEGVGGRNTEFALAAAIELARRGRHDWVVASLATDGDDGPTGAAGAIVTGETVARAAAAGIDAERALAENDSLAPLSAARAAVVTGPTGTNVNDLYFTVRCRPASTEHLT